ncbi:hypothetical protein VP217E381_P0067 [Vibrio phage 217E38-1]|nr:hypothetical protein VP217E381_P0067 [Vibrio phage 217E38-1]
MSDLDNAINSINASAVKAENTATFLDDMSTFDDQSSVTNPNNGQTVASIPKQVKDRTDELFAAAESDINQAVATTTQNASDAAQSASDASESANEAATTVETQIRERVGVYKIGNISDYAGQQLTEAEKENQYQYPDDSGEWYGPIQDQTFPITIPADPSNDDGWALVNSLNTSSGDARYTRNESTIGVIISAGSSGELFVGQRVEWRGYHSESDGGSNWGVVKSGAHTEDGGSIFSIDSNTYIKANLKGNGVNSAKFGLREGVSFASDNHSRALKLFDYAKSNNTSELKFSALYFISDGISITQQGLRLTFSSKWNESGLQMTSDAGPFSAMLILDAQNIVIKGGFFATESNQTSIFIRDGGKSHLEDFTVKFSEYGVLWEKGNAITVKGMYAEVCVNGFVAQPRGEGDCNGGNIQGRAFGCSGVGLDLRPNIAPTGAGAPPLHNTIDFSCEAGGVGFKSYEARNNVGVIYCEGNTTNYDVDGTANLWTLKNADNQPDIIKDFASGFDFRGGTSYFNPCYIERRVQNRDFIASGSLIGNGIDIYIVKNNSGSSREMTLGFLSYVPVGHKCEIYMNASSNLLSIAPPSGITLIGDSSDLYGGPQVNDVVRLTVTKTSPTEAILWRT